MMCPIYPRNPIPDLRSSFRFLFLALDKGTFSVYNVIRLYQCTSCDTKESDDRSQFTYSDLLSANVLFQRAD